MPKPEISVVTNNGARFGVVVMGSTTMILTRADDERWQPQFTISATGAKAVPDCFKLSSIIECELDAA